MKHCIHCGSTEDLTEHHVHPLAHFGTPRTNKFTVTLCRKCHDILETGILFLEAYVGGTKYGTRKKLKAHHYEKLLETFTRKKHQ